MAPWFSQYWRWQSEAEGGSTLLCCRRWPPASAAGAREPKTTHRLCQASKSQPHWHNTQMSSLQSRRHSIQTRSVRRHCGIIARLAAHPKMRSRASRIWNQTILPHSATLIKLQAITALIEGHRETHHGLLHPVALVLVPHNGHGGGPRATDGAAKCACSWSSR